MGCRQLGEQRTRSTVLLVGEDGREIEKDRAVRDPVAVIMTTRSPYRHSLASCVSVTHATAGTLETANARGLKPCPKCWQAKGYIVPETPQPWEWLP